MSSLQPQMQALVDIFVGAGGKPFPECTPEEGRAQGAAGIPLAGDGPQVASVQEISIPTRAGSVTARVYRPEEAEPTAVVVWFHGGGWVIGSPEADDAIARTLAKASGALVVNADYRHGPEAPFPAATDDSFDVVRWVADELADGRPLVVSGSSAGANLATVAALRARDQGGPEIAFQVLIYPVTDHDFTNGSYTEYATQVPLGRAEMEWYWGHYAPDVRDRDSPHASPLRAESLAGLPPAYLTVAGADPLHDEGVAYAEALEAAGVAVTLRDDPGITHGYVNFLAMVDVGGEVLAEAGAAIRALVRTPAE
jgi:acetyl esterase